MAMTPEEIRAQLAASMGGAPGGDEFRARLPEDVDMSPDPAQVLRERLRRAQQAGTLRETGGPLVVPDRAPPVLLRPQDPNQFTDGGVDRFGEQPVTPQLMGTKPMRVPPEEMQQQIAARGKHPYLRTRMMQRALKRAIDVGLNNTPSPAPGIPTVPLGAISGNAGDLAGQSTAQAAARGLHEGDIAPNGMRIVRDPTTGMLRYGGSAGAAEAGQPDFATQVRTFLAAHPQYAGRPINLLDIPELRDAQGNYIGPIRHPDHQQTGPHAAAAGLAANYSGFDPRTGRNYDNGWLYSDPSESAYHNYYSIGGGGSESTAAAPPPAPTNAPAPNLAGATSPQQPPATQQPPALGGATQQPRTGNMEKGGGMAPLNTTQPPASMTGATSPNPAARSIAAPNSGGGTSDAFAPDAPVRPGTATGTGGVASGGVLPGVGGGQPDNFAPGAAVRPGTSEGAGGQGSGVRPGQGGGQTDAFLPNPVRPGTSSGADIGLGSTAVPRPGTNMEKGGGTRPLTTTTPAPSLTGATAPPAAPPAASLGGATAPVNVGLEMPRAGMTRTFTTAPQDGNLNPSMFPTQADRSYGDAPVTAGRSEGTGGVGSGAGFMPDANLSGASVAPGTSTGTGGSASHAVGTDPNYFGGAVSPGTATGEGGTAFGGATAPPPPASMGGGFNTNLAARVGLGGENPRTRNATPMFKDGGRVRLGKSSGVAAETAPGYANGGAVMKYADGGSTDAFRPSYQDYLRFSSVSQGSEATGSGGSEEWWNSLSPNEQFQLVGGGLALMPNDPRYQHFAELTHPEPGRPIIIYGPENNQREITERTVDPHRVYHGGGITVTPWDNHTPRAQNNADRAIGPFLMGAALLVGGAAFAAGGLGGAGAAGAGEGLGESAGFIAGTDAAESGGTLALNAAGTGVAPYVPVGAESVGLGAAEGELTGGGAEFNPEYLSNIETPPINPMNDAELNSVMQQLQSNPSMLQQVASRMGTTANNLLSNPQNLMRAARVATMLISAAGGGGGAQHVPLSQQPPGGGTTTQTGGGAPPPGSGVPPPPPVGGGGDGGAPIQAPNTQVTAPAREHSAQYQENPSGIDVNGLLDSLKPENFQGGPATFDRWNASRDQFQPITSMLLDDAQNAGSEDAQAAAAGRAGSDVAQSFANSEAQRRRNLIAQGINPDDGRGTGFESDRLSALDEAKAMAGSKNNARRGEMDRGVQTRVAVAGVGNAQAGQALAADSTALNYDLSGRRLAADTAGRRAELGVRASDSASDRSLRRYQTDTNADLTREHNSQELATGNADRDLRRFGIETSDSTQRHGIDTSANTSRYGIDVSRLTAAERNTLDRDRLNADITSGNLNRDRQNRIDTGAGITRTIQGVGDLYALGRGAFSSGGGDGNAAYNLWGGGDNSSVPNMGGEEWMFRDGGPVDIGLGSDTKRRPLHTHGGRVRRRVRSYDSGGPVSGPGTSTSDSIRARLSDGEHVVNTEGTELAEAENPGYLDDLNEKGLRIRKVREMMRRHREAVQQVGLGMGD